MEEETYETQAEPKHNSSVSEKKPNKSSKTTFIVLFVLLILIAGVYICIKNYMPEIMLKKGISYLEREEYQKALNMFDSVSNMLPLDERPVNYQVETLSRMLSNDNNDYKTQKALYEISQYDDFDAATERAEHVLSQIRQKLNNDIGSNYVDNILYDELLIRWNTAEPITYSISYDASTPTEYVDAVREAFMNWQNATNGDISFRDTPGNTNANIRVKFTNSLKADNLTFNPKQSGNAVPLIADNTLKNVDIYIKPSDRTGIRINREEVFNIALHEIGHAIGLWGHSADESDVMFSSGDFSGNYEQKMITPRDLNTLKAIYGMEPDVIDKPLSSEQLSGLYYHHIFTSHPGENYERDIQRLINELRNNGSNIVPLVDLAINYAHLRNYERSNYILQGVLPLAYNSVENQFVILYNMAANYYKMKNYPISRRYLGLATQFGDDFDTQLLDVFLDIKEYNMSGDQSKLDIAEKKLQALEKVYPDNIEVALKLVEINFKRGGNKKIEQEIIERLLRNNPRAINDRRVSRYTIQVKKTKSY